MNKDFFIHARYKLRHDKIKDEYENMGLTCVPLTDEEKKTHVIGSNGGITISVVKNSKGTLYWGIAKCNITDTFDKSLGRLIATKKAEGYKIETPDAECDVIRDTSSELMNMIPEGVGLRGLHNELKINGIILVEKK